MKERPILFSAPMVRALLDGSKTQTRRVIKCQPPEDEPISAGFYHPSVTDKHGQDHPGDEVFGAYTSDGEWAVKCPHGQHGDRLWVRESFWGCDLPGYGDQPCVVYDDEWIGKDYKPSEARPWGRKFGRIPSIHMPRDCSRILLEIAAVRVERLNDISDADATAEGVSHSLHLPCGRSASGNFAHLWWTIHGDDAWEVNPWVWVIEFRRVTP